jgi:hypothetical protein
MEATSPLECVAIIGETAGVVWRVLSENGPMSLAKLVKAVDEPRDTVMQAIGWLARENKLCIEDEGRTRMVSLAE